MKNNTDKDSFGKGLLSYYNGNVQAKFSVYSDIADTERWPISTFFRKFENMPKNEQIALSDCIGRVLDIGAGAGSHSLWLNERNHKVTSIDISEGAVEVMKKRGLDDVRLVDYFDFSGEKYDTLLLLMNGIGIIQTLDRLPEFFAKAKELLTDKGCILLDSSNLIYLFMDEDGTAMINLNSDKYYGEIEYRIDFSNHHGVPFKWVFVDFEILSDIASENGFNCEKIYEDDHYLFLAKLTLQA